MMVIRGGEEEGELKEHKGDQIHSDCLVMDDQAWGNENTKEYIDVLL